VYIYIYVCVCVCVLRFPLRSLLHSQCNTFRKTTRASIVVTDSQACSNMLKCLKCPTPKCEQHYPQDIFQLLPHSSKVGVTVFEDSPEERTLTHRLYCPVKNNLQDAAKKATSGVPSGSAISGELAVYAANACALRALGASIESPVPCMLGGIEDKAWPRIVFMPSFALGFGQLRTRCFKDMNSVKITARSTLVVEGDVVFEDLDLDGTLVVHCVVGARVGEEYVAVCCQNPICLLVCLFVGVR
jgi:hypothetical protein